MQKRGVFEFLNKKGTLALRQSLIHLGMLALVAVVTYFLISYVDSIKQNSDFEILFLSRDLALLADTLYSAHGNVDYLYSSDKSSAYNFEFKTLSSIDDKPLVQVKYEGISKSYPYAKSSQDQDTFSVQAPKSIKFSKENNQLKINKNE